MGVSGSEPCRDNRALLCKQIKFLFDAENMIEEAFHTMHRQAWNPRLKNFFENHRRVTQAHISILLDVFVLLGIEPERQACHGCAGLLNESREILQSITSQTLIDAALLLAAQELEHYEIACYKGTATLAEQAREANIADLLRKILEDEYEAERDLSQLSQALTTRLTHAQSN